MKKFNILSIACIAGLMSLTSCQPEAITPEQVFHTEDEVTAMLNDKSINPEGYKVYHLDEFVDTYMTERGDSCWLYRTRSEVSDGGKIYYLFSIDTLPANGQGIYIRGRISTDDYGGNFYKSLVIQEVVNGKQQNLRLSVDIGSASGLYQMGQEILIRCNGLAVGRYANQPQLCVPSYNNNTNANNAAQKVGWAAGRIPNQRFRMATTLIGVPDQSKLKYDTIKISDFFGKKDLVEVRKMDGMLVVLKGVHFTGQYEYNGTLTECNMYDPAKADSINGDPETDEYAAVFGPTTKNIGYPQSRVIEDAEGNHTLVSTSEYAKYAYYYLPESKYVGSVTGILGFYADNNRYATQSYLDGYEWSITPRDILRIKDIKLYDGSTPWQPTEFTKNSADK